MLNKRLLELGARSFHETGYADDGVGYVKLIKRERERETENTDILYLLLFYVLG